MIPFTNRFHGHNSLNYVYRHGQVLRTRFATLKTTTNSHRKESRIAVVVSKKIFKSAVKRNRVRRRVYEYSRQMLPNLNNTYDIVVIISTPDVLGLPHPELTKQLDDLFSQANLYKQP